MALTDSQAAEENGLWPAVKRIFSPSFSKGSGGDLCEREAKCVKQKESCGEPALTKPQSKENHRQTSFSK